MTRWEANVWRRSWKPKVDDLSLGAGAFKGVVDRRPADPLPPRPEEDEVAVAGVCEQPERFARRGVDRDAFYSQRLRLLDGNDSAPEIDVLIPAEAQKLALAKAGVEREGYERQEPRGGHVLLAGGEQRPDLIGGQESGPLVVNR